MSKKLLCQYKDLLVEIDMLKRRLAELSKGRKVQDIVKGSNPEFPYEQRIFFLEGIKDNREARVKTYYILDERLKECEELKLKIEEFIANIPDSKVRVILDMRYIQQKSWVAISRRFGSGDESYARKIHDRYLDSLNND